MSHVEISTNTVPEIWYKTQRIIRAILVAAPVFLIGLNASLPLLAAAFNSPDVPPAVYAWVNGIVVILLAIVGVLTRIIAIPAVNAWLTKLGAGSVPKNALVVINPAGQPITDKTTGVNTVIVNPPSQGE